MLSVATNYRIQKTLEKEQEIFAHPAWHGQLVGIDSEDFLRGKRTFSYLIRKGEAKFHYYLSYVIQAPFSYKHQPFTLCVESDQIGLRYRNGHSHWAENLEELIPLIIHQPLEGCFPIAKA